MNNIYDKTKKILLKNIKITFPNIRRPKYSHEEILNLIFYCLKSGLSYRKITENPLITNKKIHFTTIFKIYKKWNDANIFELTLKELLFKYSQRKVHVNNNYLMIIDTTTIYNLFGIELTGKHYQTNKKTTKISLICDDLGIPICVKLFSANIHDSKTIIDTVQHTLIDNIFTKKITLLGDKGYQTNKNTYEYLNRKNIRLITYKKFNQEQNSVEDEFLLKKRYLIENVFSQLKLFRRILLRYDKTIKNFLGFIFIGCILHSQSIFDFYNCF